MTAALVGGVRKLVALSLVVIAGCGPTIAPDESASAGSGASIQTTDYLSGCHGVASSTIPSDGSYVMTTFGGGGDTQQMSCGGLANGVDWYAASRQRYGCGAKLQVEANGNCVVVEAQDYGPDVCVEAAAHSPILDMSPRAAEALYGVSGAGWSDHLIVTVTEVDGATPEGPCDSGGSGSGSAGDAACSSSTLGRDVDSGTCVQSAADGSWYICNDGNWDASDGVTDCGDTYGWCDSATLGESVPPRTCVQAASDSEWYQCNGQGWVMPVDPDAGTGPIGDCSDEYPL